MKLAKVMIKPLLTNSLDTIQTFALIVYEHPYCAHNSCRNVKFILDFMSKKEELWDRECVKLRHVQARAHT